MALLYQGFAYSRKFLIVQTSDHITGLTGAAPTVTLSKGSGGAFAAAAGAVTEIANGIYQCAFSTVDTNTVGDLAVHCVATVGSGDPTDFVDQVVAAPTIKKNTALPAFQFIMTSGSTFTPTTGLTVAANRSIDGAGFAPCTNSVTELSNGWYQINLSQSDLNGTSIALRFSAASANDQDVTIITTP